MTKTPQTKIEIYSEQDMIREAVNEYNHRNPDAKLEWKTGGYRSIEDYEKDDALRDLEAHRVGFGNSMLLLLGGFSIIVLLVSLIK